jgi:hypothetical protein
MTGPTKKIRMERPVPRFPLSKAVFRLFGYRAGFARTLQLGVYGLWTPLIVGCGSAETRDQKALDPYAREAAGVFAIDQSATGTPTESAWWSVLVATVPSGRMDDAQRMLDTVHTTGLTGAYLALRDKRPIIAYGRFDDPAQPEAQAGLKRVRETNISGMNPFGAAMLIPPAAQRTGSETDELNLRSVRARLTRSEAAYTLQVAVYARPDMGRPTPEELALFQREAERAARQLRADGEVAFYYHGPNMSMVTVGIFSEDDHDGETQPPIESVRLRQARQTHPYNLLNGQGINETVRTASGGSAQRLQSSRLVAIPDN